MKAMLYADWMNLRRSMKAMVIATVVIALASIVSGNGLSFVSAMLCMLSLMVPATLMSSDYAYGWDKLSLSLPVSRRDVVSSKFAISLLVNLTVAALGMICIAGMNAFGGDAMAEDMMGMLACEAVGGMDSWPVGQLAAFFGGLVIVGAIVYAVCWRIGVGIYRKREL